MIIKRFLKMLKDKTAAAAVEFALAAPLLILMATGGFEMTRYILIQQKVSKTVSSMADLVARSPSITDSDLTNMYAAIDHLMEPYKFQGNGVILISSVSNNGTSTRVNWQRSYGIAGASNVGAVGAVANLPAGFTLADNEDTIVAEIRYNYSPLIAPNIAAARQLYKIKFAKPRLGALTVINP